MSKLTAEDMEPQISDERIAEFDAFDDKATELLECFVAGLLQDDKFAVMLESDEKGYDYELTHRGLQLYDRFIDRIWAVRDAKFPDAIYNNIIEPVERI